MRTATIRGHATSTIKHKSLEGWRLLVAVPDSPDVAPQIVEADELERSAVSHLSSPQKRSL